MKEVELMIEKLEESSGKIVGFTLSGRLHDEDYKIFVPQLEKATPDFSPISTIFTVGTYMLPGTT